MSFSSAVATLLLVSTHLQSTSCLTFLVPPSRFGVLRLSTSTTRMASNDDSMGDAEPFFEMRQIPTATTSTKLEHFVECAENDGCDVHEMMEMIDELERLNMECEGEHSRECNLDAIAARNVLKVALASKVAVEDIVGELANEECNPYLEMYEMNDECIDVQHPIPTATSDSELIHMMECAQDGEACDVSEMMEMIDELERLNKECEGTLSRECSLQAVEARNLLKVALASQAAAEEAAVVRKRT